MRGDETVEVIDEEIVPTLLGAVAVSTNRAVDVLTAGKPEGWWVDAWSEWHREP